MQETVLLFQIRIHDFQTPLNKRLCALVDVLPEVDRLHTPGKPEITIVRISIPAGARLEMHSHPVIKAIVLSSG